MATLGKTYEIEDGSHIWRAKLVGEHRTLYSYCNCELCGRSLTHYYSLTEEEFGGEITIGSECMKKTREVA